MNLIHHKELFTKDSILERSTKYGFANPLAVEMFLWDIEVAAQLQQMDKRLLLKGGTAAQLYLPTDQQRGSVDIDMTVTAHVRDAEIPDFLQRIAENVPPLSFRYYEPKTSNANLPLVTYFVNVPSSLELQGRKQLEIKVDFLLESAELPTREISGAQTFALDVKQMRIPTLGTCIGDKLLTLAKGSIGISKEEDYPKQMYDVDLLSEQSSEPVFVDIVNAVRKLTPIEARYRGQTTTPIEALQNVCTYATDFARVDSSKGRHDDRKHVESFQQFLVSRSQRLPFYGWASRALRVRFLATLVEMGLNAQISMSDGAKRLILARDLARSFDNIQGDREGKSEAISSR